MIYDSNIHMILILYTYVKLKIIIFSITILRKHTMIMVRMFN